MAAIVLYIFLNLQSHNIRNYTFIRGNCTSGKYRETQILCQLCLDLILKWKKGARPWKRRHAVLHSVEWILFLSYVPILVFCVGQDDPQFLLKNDGLIIGAQDRNERLSVCLQLCKECLV